VSLAVKIAVFRALSEDRRLSDEESAALSAVKALTAKSGLVRLLDVANATGGNATQRLAALARVLGELQRRGMVGYNLKNGYTVAKAAG
jgi:hypothetical protein